MTTRKYPMLINRYAGALFFTIALLSQSAFAAVVLQINIANPNAIIFSSTGANSQIFDNSSDECLDGITLLDVLAADGVEDDSVSISGGLTPSGSATVPYTRVETQGSYEGFPRSITFYNCIGSPGGIQTFETTVSAFSGTGTAAAGFGANFPLMAAGQTGDLVSGSTAGGVSGVIGQWEIIDTPVIAPPTTTSVPVMPLWLLGMMGGLLGFLGLRRLRNT
jgi:hypothetical protein